MSALEDGSGAFVGKTLNHGIVSTRDPNIVKR